jgi:hypothetical protein
MVAILRQSEETGNPLITVNPDHVVTLRPRKTYIPNQASQSGGLLNGYKGTQVELVTGRTILVCESHEEVHAKLWPAPVQPPVGASPNIEAANKAAAPKPEPEAVTEEESPAPKKAPAKVGAAKDEPEPEAQ